MPPRPYKPVDCSLVDAADVPMVVRWDWHALPRRRRPSMTPAMAKSIYGANSLEYQRMTDRMTQLDQQRAAEEQKVNQKIEQQF